MKPAGYRGKFSSRAVLLQGQETDRWAFYQAKSIKSHAYDLQKQHLELLTQLKLPSTTRAEFQKTIQEYDGAAISATP